MELYAIYKDGLLYKASYKQNVPFYNTLIGAKRAMQNIINRNIPYDFIDDNYKEYKVQEYICQQRERFEIRKFILVDKGAINI